MACSWADARRIASMAASSARPGSAWRPAQLRTQHVSTPHQSAACRPAGPPPTPQQPKSQPSFDEPSIKCTRVSVPPLCARPAAPFVAGGLALIPLQPVPQPVSFACAPSLQRPAACAAATLPSPKNSLPCSCGTSKPRPPFLSLSTTLSVPPGTFWPCAWPFLFFQAPPASSTAAPVPLCPPGRAHTLRLPRSL